MSVSGEVTWPVREGEFSEEGQENETKACIVKYCSSSLNPSVDDTTMK